MENDGANAATSQDMGSELFGQHGNDAAGGEGERYGGVRFAEVYDIPQLLIWGEEFHKKSPWSSTAFSTLDTAQKMREMIQSDHACILVHDKGMIGGFLAPLFFDQKTILASEMFWWAEGGGRLLLDAFEAWAADLGATGVVMAAEQYADRSENDRIDSIYARRGYKPNERNFIRYF